MFVCMYVRIGAKVATYIIYIIYIIIYSNINKNKIRQKNYEESNKNCTAIVAIVNNIGFIDEWMN